MNRYIPKALCVLVAVLSQLSCSGDHACTFAGALYQQDFDHSVNWPITSTKSNQPGVAYGKYGTSNLTDSAEASGGLALIVDTDAQPGWVYEKSGYVHRTEVTINDEDFQAAWSANISSGPQGLKNNESNLGKLTLSFSLSASRALPVKVSIESLDGNQVRTGGLVSIIYPAAAEFYERYSIDLSEMKPDGRDVFDPLSPFVRIVLEVSSQLGWPAASHHELHLDNVHYAAAAYCVSPTGSDSNDGKSEATAFASPQRAIDLAQPGDIILVMDGMYGTSAINNANGNLPKMPVAKFVRPGAPSGWITLKNYPGHRPQFSAHGQQAVNISYGESNAHLAYIEVRGLHIRGNGDTAKEMYPEEIGKALPNTDSMGIVVNGRRNSYKVAREDDEIVHNIRLVDNVVEFCTADGIYIEYCDWLFIEKNIIQNNCWTTTGYAPSGLAVMGYANFDAQDNVFKMLIAGNRVNGNQLKEFNHPRGQAERLYFYNGDGILLDANAERPPAVYLGRTLVQNNVVFNNGGGGIQMWGSHRLDIVNNTVHLNGTNLAWGQLGFERCRDVRLFNNIIVAQKDRSLDTWFAGRVDEQTSGITRSNNLYWGGARRNIDGINDLVADPQFVSATSDSKTANFQLRKDSPALKAGRWETFTPIVDYAGKLRPFNVSPSIGAVQAEQPTP